MGYRGTIFNLNLDREREGRPALSTAWPGIPELPAPQSTYVTPVDYPTGQKIALLLLRKGELANDLVTRLRAMGADVTGPDWRVMIEHGRIGRIGGRLQLTPMGLHAAQEIARDLARRLGIHRAEPRKASGNHGPSAQCTCGFNVYSHRGRSGEANVAGQMSQHLRQARDGKLPPAYRLQAHERHNR